MGARSRTRVPAPFVRLADELRVVADTLNEYLYEANVDIEGTPAYLEYSEEAKYADDQISDPVTHAILRSIHSMVFAADSTLGLAACIESEHVVFASMSLVRNIMSACGVTYYFLEPDIGTRERLRRVWNRELDSIREELNATDPKTMREAFTYLRTTLHRYLTWARAHGYVVSNRKVQYGNVRHWLIDGDSATPTPSEIQLVKGVLASLGDGTLGLQAYRFTSAFAHSQPHALGSLVQADLPVDPQETGPRSVRYQGRCLHYVADGLRDVNKF